jgi:hypothetical protein
MPSKLQFVIPHTVANVTSGASTEFNLILNYCGIASAPDSSWAGSWSPTRPSLRTGSGIVDYHTYMRKRVTQSRGCQCVGRRLDCHADGKNRRKVMLFFVEGEAAPGVFPKKGGCTSN